MRAWALRLAGLSASVNALGFGAFDVGAIWHLAHDHEVWNALGNPTYGYGPFYDHGMTTTVPLLLAFLGACVVLAIGGGLLLGPRPIGVVITLVGMVMCAPFWWGFDLPFAWVNAATVLLLLSGAWALPRWVRLGADRGCEPQRVGSPVCDHLGVAARVKDRVPR